MVLANVKQDYHDDPSLSLSLSLLPSTLEEQERKQGIEGRSKENKREGEKNRGRRRQLEFSICRCDSASGMGHRSRGILLKEEIGGSSCAFLQPFLIPFLFHHRPFSSPELFLCFYHGQAAKRVHHRSMSPPLSSRQAYKIQTIQRARVTRPFGPNDFLSQDTRREVGYLLQ